jgi:hypothetical protein
LKLGSWVTENIETAKSFGDFLYKIHVNEDEVNWEYLSPEMIDGEWRGVLKNNTPCEQIL